MTGDTTISIALLLSAVSAIIAIGNYVRGGKHDIKEDSKGMIEANIKLDQIFGITSDIKADLRSMQNQIEEVKEEVIIHKQEIKALWKNIDELKRKD